MAFAAESDGPALATSTVHQLILKRGAGHGVKLVRVNGSEITGRIVTVREDSVDLQTKGTSAVSNVTYAEIARVKGPGLSTGAKVGIGVAIGVVVCVGIAALVIDHEIYKTSR